MKPGMARPKAKKNRRKCGFADVNDLMCVFLLTLSGSSHSSPQAAAPVKLAPR